MKKPSDNNPRIVNHRFNVDPALVMLYVAKKNDAWLMDDENVK
jgi:hypothetical protein